MNEHYNGSLGHNPNDYHSYDPFLNQEPNHNTGNENPVNSVNTIPAGEPGTGKDYPTLAVLGQKEKALTETATAFDDQLKVLVDSNGKIINIFAHQTLLQHQNLNDIFDHIIELQAHATVNVRRKANEIFQCADPQQLATAEYEMSWFTNPNPQEVPPQGCLSAYQVVQAINNLAEQGFDSDNTISATANHDAAIVAYTISDHYYTPTVSLNNVVSRFLDAYVHAVAACQRDQLQLLQQLDPDKIERFNQVANLYGRPDLVIPLPGTNQSNTLVQATNQQSGLTADQEINPYDDDRDWFEKMGF